MVPAVLDATGFDRFESDNDTAVIGFIGQDGDAGTAGRAPRLSRHEARQIGMNLSGSSFTAEDAGDAKDRNV